MNLPKTPISLLIELKPSQYAFLETISDLIDDSILTKIAHADTFNSQIKECFNILKNIQTQKKLPKNMEGVYSNFQEVLSLTRWAPTNSLTASFVCTTLLIAPIVYKKTGWFYYEEGEENTTIAILIDSINKLEDKYKKAAMQLIVWRIISFNEEKQEVDTFFIFALLLLMIQNKESQVKINSVVKWLIESDNYSRDFHFSFRNNTFLLGLTPFDQRHNDWRSLTKNMLAQLNFITDKNLKEKLLKIADSIINNKELKNTYDWY